MTTTTELYERILKARTTVGELDHQLRETRRQLMELERQMSAAIAFERYSLKPGDVIDVTKTTGGFRRGQEKFRMKITWFHASNPDDETPSIHGVNVRKDGTVGEQRRFAYPSLDEYIFTKVGVSE